MEDEEHYKELQEQYVRAIRRAYYQTHKVKNSERHKQYYKKHKKELKAYYKQWSQENPDKRNAISRVQRYKRRGLGSIPLNEFYKGSEGHHIDKTHIIYIPKRIHRSIKHNVFTGEGMAKINAIALDYLTLDYLGNQRQVGKW